MSRFSSLPEYEQFIYNLLQDFPAILRSTLVLVKRGRYFAEVRGELAFADDHRLVVYERLRWDDGPLTIVRYGYEVWRGDVEVCWYDSQSHPQDPTLAGTDPHHKHLPPDAKHHRVPAPGLRFDPPNLPFLIREIESTLLVAQKQSQEKATS
jgi:hypothetical protein